MASTARQRREKKQWRVGVCIDTRDGPARGRLQGVYKYAKERGWHLFLVRGVDSRALTHMAKSRLDGAILFDRPLSFQRHVKNLGIVCVETSARNLALDDAAVFADDAAITRIAVEHLARSGFVHLGYCGLARSYPSSLRGKSFVENARRLGLPVTTFEDAQPDGGADLDLLIRWLRALPNPAGVLAFDDKMAERVLAACQWANLRVPDIIGVVGIGDDDLICELASPPLTSVALPTREIGRRAAELLGTIFNRMRLSKKHWLVAPLEIVVRASTDRLPPMHPSVSAAIEIMRVGMGRGIGTDQVAVAVNISRRTLERHFRKDIGQTVHEFLTGLRLRRAKQLLRQSDGAMGEIARECGYSGLSAFRRMFCAQAGSHPEFYRKTHRANRANG